MSCNHQNTFTSISDNDMKCCDCGAWWGNAFASPGFDPPDIPGKSEQSTIFPKERQSVVHSPEYLSSDVQVPVPWSRSWDPFPQTINVQFGDPLPTSNAYDPSKTPSPGRVVPITQTVPPQSPPPVSQGIATGPCLHNAIRKGRYTGFWCLDCGETINTGTMSRWITDLLTELKKSGDFPNG